MKIVKITGVVFIAMMMLLFAGGFLLPSAAHVERSVIIAKPKSEVFAFLTDYHNFTSWSPWHTIDPNTQYEFSGADSGMGAKMSWRSSNPQVDNGWQQIIDIKGQELVKIKLVFGNGSGGGTVHYRLQETDEGTSLTWDFDTDFGNNPFGRYIGLMMDNMLGPHYEAGLANLKAILEE